MIIQHNIMSLNAHRQLGGNTSLVSKNLEKLSSGFKINRAGDDAAGLAISEKMRSQITGLTRAQANAQDGISLVQTAEGALTEVHSMLNRMVDLATQSSNGTMQSDDRQKIQDEMDSLTSEIDRISQSTNFNGINLLDGSLGGGAGKVNLTGAKVNGADVNTISQTAATKASVGFGTAINAGTDTATIKYTDEAGKEQTVTLDAAAIGTGDAEARANAIAAALNKDAGFSALFKATAGATADAGKLKFEALKAGESKAQVTGANTTGGAAVNALGTPAAGADASMSVAGTALIAGDSFTVNGKTFEFVANATTAATIKGAVAVDVSGADLAADLTALNKALDEAGTGVKVASSGGNIVFSPNHAAAAKGLILQIGDTADAFNKVTVSVADMGKAGLAIDKIDVKDQTPASDAIKVINAAIETVSKNRSAMGALQNRLEHTINNLGVAAENMTAAESRVRDVDMAKEMANFTKNNVLTQAAQAMLAQANQQPQQVLQLLR